MYSLDKSIANVSKQTMFFSSKDTENVDAISMVLVTKCGTSLDNSKIRENMKDIWFLVNKIDPIYESHNVINLSSLITFLFVYHFYSIKLYPLYPFVLKSKFAWLLDDFVHAVEIIKQSIIRIHWIFRNCVDVGNSSRW